MRKIGLFITLLIIGGIILLAYALLGGFNDVEIRVVDCSEIRLIGIDYRGTPQDESLTVAFKKVEDKRPKDNHLHTVYFVEPAGKRDTMHVFVGIEANGVSGVEVEGWDSLSFKCESAIVVGVEGHRFVMPNPEKIKNQISSYVKDHGLVLQGVFIDRIIERDKVEVWAPLE